MITRFKKLDFEKQLYVAGLIALFFLVLMGPVWYLYVLPKYDIPCIFYTLTGFYCPGCGGTRAFSAMVHGHFVRSFYLHPLVIYASVLYIVYMMSHTLSIFNPKLKGMKLKDAYLYIAIGIVFVNLIIKNILLHKYGIMLPK